MVFRLDNATTVGHIIQQALILNLNVIVSVPLIRMAKVQVERQIIFEMRTDVRNFDDLNLTFKLAE